MNILALVGTSGELLAKLRASHKVEIAQSQGAFVDMVTLDWRRHRRFDALLAPLPREGTYIAAYVRALGWRRPVLLTCKDLPSSSQEFVELTERIGKDVALCLGSNEFEASRVESVVPLNPTFVIKQKSVAQLTPLKSVSLTANAVIIDGQSHTLQFQAHGQRVVLKHLIENPNRPQRMESLSSTTGLTQGTIAAYINWIRNCARQIHSSAKKCIVRKDGFVTYVPYRRG